MKVREVEVKTQAQLDEALKDRKPSDVIVCVGGTWDNPLIVRGSSRVVAWGSSSVEAWGSSRVEAWGSSSVVARGSSRVVAAKYVAVQKQFGHTGTISGGVLIELPDVTAFTPAEWCDYYGVKVAKGKATLFKAVEADFSTPRARLVGVAYVPGSKVAAPDWDATPECGGGLHCSPSPVMAEQYTASATRYVELQVALKDFVVIDDKIKARIVKVVCEVDRHGEALEEGLKERPA